MDVFKARQKKFKENQEKNEELQENIKVPENVETKDIETVDKEKETQEKIKKIKK